MSEPKRHHYLPQFYLEGFSTDGFLWLYDADVDDCRRQTPKNTAVKKHYYAITDDSGSKDNTLEKILAQVEGAAKPVIDALTAGEDLTDEQRGDLSWFLAFLKARTPEFESFFGELNEHFARMWSRRRFSDVERAKAALDELAEATGERFDVTPEEMVEFAKSADRYTVSTPREASIGAMISTAADAVPFFFQMDWDVLHSDEKSAFVTSDDPFTLLPPQGWRPDKDGGVGFLIKGTKKIIPLNSGTCLVMGDKGDRLGHVKVDQERVRDFNLLSSRTCDRFVIGRDEALVRSVVTGSGLPERKRGSRWRFSGSEFDSRDEEDRDNTPVE